MNPRIMLVEDDLILVDGLNQVLTNAGFSMTVCADGEAADRQLAAEAFDLLLLDIGLPDMDGFEVLRRLRDRGNALPVLMLTARDAIPDRVHGFELGADDYVVKPFAVPELLARIRALLRRGQGAVNRLTCQALAMDLTARRAWIGEEPLELSAREWTVLEQLLKNVDKVVSKQQITEAIGGADAGLSANAVEVYISRLRGKLDESGARIRTIHGFGYLLEQRPHAET